MAQVTQGEPVPTVSENYSLDAGMRSSGALALPKHRQMAKATKLVRQGATEPKPVSKPTMYSNGRFASAA